MQIGGSPITGFKVYWDAGDGLGNFNLFETFNDPTDVAYITTVVSQGTTYEFKILAFNIYGDGILSEPAVIITPAAAPDAPTALTLVSADSSQITFSWTPPYDGGKPITDYKLFWDNGSAGASFVAATPSSVGDATPQVTVNTGLSPGTFYQFKVLAVNEISDGALSDAVSFIAADYPDAPTNVVKVLADAGQIQISWQAPIIDGGSSVINYHVYMDGVVVTPAEGTSGLTHWTESAVNSGQTHDFTVSAVNSRGEGAQSTPDVSIIAATVPTVPLNLRKSTASISLITIDWDLPTHHGDTAIQDYEVWWDNGAQNDVYVLLVDSTGNSLTFTQSTDLQAGHSYSFKVRAVNAVGPSEFSDVLTVIAGTLPAKPPTPTKFSASVDEIEIRWAAASDGGSSITDYKVYWDSGLNNGVQVYAGNTDGYLTFAVTAVDDGIVGGETYVFTVSAVNAIDEGPQSDPVSVIAATLPEQPAAPALVS